MKRSITIYRTPTDEWWAKTLENLWVTVLEGASNYWVDKINYDMPEGMLFKDDLPSLKSISRLPDELKIVIANDGDWDANDADHIFQLGVFGEVRYG